MTQEHVGFGHSGCALFTDKTNFPELSQDFHTPSMHHCLHWLTTSKHKTPAITHWCWSLSRIKLRLGISWFLDE